MLCNRLYDTLFMDKKAKLLYNVYLYIIVFKFLKCSLVADKRLRSGLKALGYVLVAPSGRALNACAYSLIQLTKLELERSMHYYI